MNTKTGHAELLEQHLFDINTDRDPFYRANAAELYTINQEGHISKLDQIADLYDLISSAIENAHQLTDAHTVALVTTGWAAPLDADGQVSTMPSLHAERRRVLLTIVATGSDIVSIIRFADDPQSTTIEEGLGAGRLADAMKDLVNAIQKANQQ